jgi:hypothetical protein
MTKGCGVSFVIDRSNEDQTWEMSNDTLTMMMTTMMRNSEERQDQGQGLQM